MGQIIPVGTEMRHGKKALKEQVSGGTGVAVQMAINAQKPVYVFDQVQGGWFAWDGKTFVPTKILFSPTATLSPNAILLDLSLASCLCLGAQTPVLSSKTVADPIASAVDPVSKYLGSPKTATVPFVADEIPKFVL